MIMVDSSVSQSSQLFALRSEAPTGILGREMTATRKLHIWQCCCLLLDHILKKLEKISKKELCLLEST